MRVWWDGKVWRTVSQRVESWVRGGLGDFHMALGAICQKSKPFPIALLSFSLPSVSITSAFFLLVSYTPSSPFPIYLSRIQTKISLPLLRPKLLTPLQSADFCKTHWVAISWLLRKSCLFRFVRRLENLLPCVSCKLYHQVCCGSWIKFPEHHKWLIRYRWREHLGFKQGLLNQRIKDEDASPKKIQCVTGLYMKGIAEWQNDCVESCWGFRKSWIPLKNEEDFKVARVISTVS